jgi:hypothetical protein
MPCYDGREMADVRIEYRDGVDPQVYNAKIAHLEVEINKLEAGLCAIITELEKRKIANEIISQASRSGLIDLMSFWERHSKQDETRLYKKFHSFSEHEQSIIRKMVKENKL